jgi:hypothetical protein
LETFVVRSDGWSRWSRVRCAQGRSAARNSLFTMTIACFVDRHAQAITCLPSVFQIRVLLDGANDSFAPDADSGGFAVPPKELPTIRPLLPLAKPQISSLIADSHGPSSGDYCTGDELKPACSDRWNVRLASPLMLENFGVARANRERQQVFCGKEEYGYCDYFQPTVQPTVYDVLYDFRVLWQSPRSSKLL